MLSDGTTCAAIHHIVTVNKFYNSALGLCQLLQYIDDKLHECVKIQIGLRKQGLRFYYSFQAVNPPLSFFHFVPKPKTFVMATPTRRSLRVST